MNIDLSRHDLFEAPLFKAAKEHKKKQEMKTKKQLDREATFFKKYAITLSPKIEKALIECKEVTFVIGSNGEGANKIVTLFNTGTFTSVEQLNKICLKKMQKVSPFVVDKKDKVNIILSGATVNLYRDKDKFDNMVVACGEFISDVRIRNFCIL